MSTLPKMNPRVGKIYETDNIFSFHNSNEMNNLCNALGRHGAVATISVGLKLNSRQMRNINSTGRYYAICDCLVIFAFMTK